jgi:hypothetical protein
MCIADQELKVTFRNVQYNMPSSYATMLLPVVTYPQTLSRVVVLCTRSTIQVLSSGAYCEVINLMTS